MPNNFPPLSGGMLFTSAYIHSKINSSDLNHDAEEARFIPDTAISLYAQSAGTPPPAQTLLHRQSVAGPRPSSCPSPQSNCSGSIEDQARSVLSSSPVHSTRSVVASSPVQSARSVVASSPVQSALIQQDLNLVTFATESGYPSLGEMYGDLEKAFSSGRPDDCSTPLSCSAHVTSSDSVQITSSFVDSVVDAKRNYVPQSMQRPTNFPPSFPARSDVTSVRQRAVSTPMTPREAVSSGMPAGFVHQRPFLHPAATANLWAPTSAQTDSQRSTEMYLQQRQQQLLNGLTHRQAMGAQAAPRPHYQHPRGYNVMSLPEPLMADIFSPASDASSSVFSPSTLEDSPVFGGCQFLSGNHAMMQQQQHQQQQRPASFSYGSQQFVPQQQQQPATSSITLTPGRDSPMMRFAPSSSVPGAQVPASIGTANVNGWNNPSDGLSSCDEQFSSPASSLALSVPPSPQLTAARGKKASGKRPKQRNSPAKPVVLRRQLVNSKYNGPVPASLQLWEFILHHLELGICKDAITWIDDRTGKFRIVNSEKIAKMWGDYRAVPAMDYEKMTRALRYYYKRRILEKLQRRLIYQFSSEVMHQVQSYRNVATST